MHVAYRLRELPAFNLEEEVRRALGTKPLPPTEGSKGGPPIDQDNARGLPSQQPLSGRLGGAGAAKSPVEETVVQSPKSEEEEPALTPEVVGIKTVWPSAAPLIEECQAALWGDVDEIRIEETGVPARVGQATHAAFKDIIEQNLTRAPDMTPYAVENGVEAKLEDLKFLSIFCVQAWQGSPGVPALKQYFPSPQCEQRLKHTIRAPDPKTGVLYQFDFVGKADVLSYFGPSPTAPPTSAAILELKTGQKRDDQKYLSQLKALGFLAAAQYKTIQQVKTTLLWVRDRTWTTDDSSRAELREWAERFVKYSAFWDGQTYAKNDRCLYCPRMAVCPGRLEYLRSIIAPIIGAKDAGRSLVYDAKGGIRPVETLAQAVRQGRFLQKVLYGFFDAIKLELYAIGPQAIPGEEGSWLATTERAGKTTVNLAKAWPVLCREFTEEELRGLATCSKSALKDAIYAKMEKGHKKAAFEAEMKQLEEAKAVTVGNASLTPTVINDPAKAVCEKKEGS